ncbi:MAG TPA: hypothetical protein VJZ78_00575 [Anaerolineales bacterium]|nr:hypothetical protein [Anaerolineales bacterium]
MSTGICMPDLTFARMGQAMAGPSRQFRSKPGVKIGNSNRGVGSPVGKSGS